MLELSERRTATHNSSFQKFDIPSPQTISAIKALWTGHLKAIVQISNSENYGEQEVILLFFEELVIVRFTDIIDRNFLF